MSNLNKAHSTAPPPVEQRSLNADWLGALALHCPDSSALAVISLRGDPADQPWRAYGWRLGCFIPPDSQNNYVAQCSVRVLEVTTGFVKQYHVRRQKQHFANLTHVTVDDVGTKVSISKAAPRSPKGVRIEPSLIVETSAGNFQYQYLLAEPCTDRAVAEALLEGIARWTGVPDCKDVTHAVRMPDGINGKASRLNADGTPWQQRVHEFNPDARYTLKALQMLFRAHDAPKRPRPAVPRPAHIVTFVPLLDRLGLHQSHRGDGLHDITCPWASEHSQDGRENTGTVYWEPSEANGWRGGFECKHGHCRGRNIQDLIRKLADYRRVA